MNRKPSIGIVSLGCSKNLVDSELMLGTLRDKGYSISSRVDNVDVLIVNTCAFIREATEESIDSILEAIELKKTGKVQWIIVAGCLPQRYRQDNLAADLHEVDAFLGVGQFHHLDGVIGRIMQGDKAHIVTRRPSSGRVANTSRAPLTPDHYAYIKISEGCDNRCTYCVIPQVRGTYRSRSMKSILAEVSVLSAKRHLAEINLVGQDTTRYGTDMYGKPRLAHLLRKLARSGDIRWIRLLYTHPAHFDHDIIDAIGEEPSLCPYVDLPLQHINDTLLKKMGRRVRRKDIERLIHRLRDRIPDLTLRTTFIVGFPGETEAHFQELLQFVKDVEFDRLGAFTYSNEEGTAASHLEGQVPEGEKKHRFELLMRSQRHISEKKNQLMIGTDIEVLVDSQSQDEPALLLARTRGDAPEVDQLVYVRSGYGKPGDFLKVRVTEAYEYDLVAEPIQPDGTPHRSQAKTAASPSKRPRQATRRPHR